MPGSRTNGSSPNHRGSLPVHILSKPPELAGSQRHCTGMHRLPIVLATMALALTAQGAVVVPNGYELLEGTSAARTPFGWSSGRVQYLIDGAQLCSTFALLTNVQFRLDGGNFNVDAPTTKTFQATLVAYEVPITPSTMTNNWTNNIGAATGTTLFSGSLTVPGAQRVYPFPNPWTIDIPFLQAFLYQRGNGNLLLDLQVSGASGDTWPADGFFFHGVEPRGEITKIWEDNACTNARGDSLSLSVPQVLGNGVVGGQLQVQHTAVARLGGNLDFVYHGIGLDNRQHPSGPLPLGLAGFGFPGCQQNLDVLLGQLLATSSGSCLWNLPTSPTLVGLPLFTQGVAFDTAAGLAVPSRNAFMARIGAAVAPVAPAQMVHQSNYVAQTTGSLSPTGYYGLVARFLGVFQ